MGCGGGLQCKMGDACSAEVLHACGGRPGEMLRLPPLTTTLSPPPLLQCAEACRAAFPDEPWMHLAGLLAPLGKLLAHAK